MQSEPPACLPACLPADDHGPAEPATSAFERMIHEFIPKETIQFACLSMWEYGIFASFYEPIFDSAFRTEAQLCLR